MFSGLSPIGGKPVDNFFHPSTTQPRSIRQRARPQFPTPFSPINSAGQAGPITDDVLFGSTLVISNRVSSTQSQELLYLVSGSRIKLESPITPRPITLSHTEEFAIGRISHTDTTQGDPALMPLGLVNEATTIPP
jgi:hypothetical protein